jgi:4-amino-4-deoxy-L-arabinose transferase-like glycosyltransferase
VFSTLLLFDTVLAACVLLAVVGLVDSRRGRSSGFILLAIGIGFGVLAKGPVVFIHVLPAIVLARWWDVRHGRSNGPPAAGPGRRWPLAVAGAVLLGAGIALAWAVPAAIAGGPSYARAIFIGQSAGRVVNSFAHRRPVWWYVPNLLWMLLPWAAWPLLWRSVKAAWVRRQLAGDQGIRLCLAVAVPALAVFSVVSGKQVHYLVPEMPFIALGLARLVAGAAEGAEHDRLTRRVSWVAVGAFGVMAVVSVAASPYLHDRYDLRPVAMHLSSAEQAGRPIAHEGRYSGQYTFLGHLHGPLAEIPTDGIDPWLLQHPNGRVVTYARSPNAAGPGVPMLVHRFGSRYVIVRGVDPRGERVSRSARSDDRIRQPPRVETP